MLDKNRNIHKLSPSEKLKLSIVNTFIEKDIWYWGEIPISHFKENELCYLYRRVFNRSAVDDFKIGIPKMKKTKKIQTSETVVYFIGSIEFGYVKIGMTSEIKQRLKQVQILCPFDVEILKIVDGGRHIEDKYHKQFSNLNTRGEWFKIEGDLKSLIESNMKIAI